jgi:hypothetical protein
MPSAIVRIDSSPHSRTMPETMARRTRSVSMPRVIAMSSSTMSGCHSASRFSPECPAPKSSIAVAAGHLDRVDAAGLVEGVAIPIVDLREDRRGGRAPGPRSRTPRVRPRRRWAGTPS